MRERVGVCGLASYNRVNTGKDTYYCSDLAPLLCPLSFSLFSSGSDGGVVLGTQQSCHTGICLSACDATHTLPPLSSVPVVSVCAWWCYPYLSRILFQSGLYTMMMGPLSGLVMMAFRVFPALHKLRVFPCEPTSRHTYIIDHFLVAVGYQSCGRARVGRLLCCALRVSAHLRALYCTRVAHTQTGTVCPCVPNLLWLVITAAETGGVHETKGVGTWVRVRVAAAQAEVFG